MKKEYPKLFSSYQQPESESYGDMQPDQSIDCFISELETKVKELNDRMAELEAEKDKIEIKLLDAYDRLSKLGDVEQWAKAVEAENKRLREEHRWIPVTERLPEDEGIYLVLCPKYVEDPIVARWNNERWFDNEVDFHQDITDHITHWMVIAQPPKEQ